MGSLTMDPPLSNTVVGDLATMWRRFAAMNIITKLNVIQPVGAATLSQLTGLLLLPTRCRLFRLGHVLVARDHVEVRPDEERMSTRTSHLWQKTHSVRYRRCCSDALFFSGETFTPYSALLFCVVHRLPDTRAVLMIYQKAAFHARIPGRLTRHEYLICFD